MNEFMLGYVAGLVVGDAEHLTGQLVREVPEEIADYVVSAIGKLGRSVSVLPSNNAGMVLIEVLSVFGEFVGVVDDDFEHQGADEWKQILQQPA